MAHAGRFRWLGIVGSAVLATFVMLTACSDNGEGERCQTENGDDDCADGLICLSSGRTILYAVDAGDGGDGGVFIPKDPTAGGNGITGGTVNPPYNDSDRCCPADRSTATHPACTIPQNSINPDAGTPGDTGAPIEASTSDAADDAADAADAADASDAADAADAD